MIIAYINHWRNYQSKPVFLKDLSLTRTFRIMKKLMQIMYYNFKNAGAKEEPVERLDEFHTVRYPWQVDYMTSDEYMDSKDQVAICSCGESIDSL